MSNSNSNLAKIEKSTQYVAPEPKLQPVKLAYLHSVVTIHDLSIAGRTELSLYSTKGQATLPKGVEMYLDSTGIRLTDGAATAIIPIANVKVMVLA